MWLDPLPEGGGGFYTILLTNAVHPQGAGGGPGGGGIREVRPRVAEATFEASAPGRERRKQPEDPSAGARNRKGGSGGRWPGRRGGGGGGGMCGDRHPRGWRNARDVAIVLAATVWTLLG